MSIQWVTAPYVLPEFLGLLERTLISDATDRNSRVGILRGTSQCARDPELGHSRATGGVVVHEPVPLIEEATAASELAEDAFGFEILPMFWVFQMTIKLVGDEIGTESVFTSETWADKHCTSPIRACDINCSAGL